MLDNISVVIIVKDGGKTINATLNSLSQFSDVVVYDNGSTDDTIEITKKFQNVNLIQGDFTGFGPTKNEATNYAKHNWILSLDADEVVDKDFLKNFRRVHLDKHTIYQIYRKNFYQDTHIKHCWGNDKIVRLYHREQTGFDNKKVHERVLLKGMKVELLRGVVNHYPYNSISSFIQKLDFYSSEFACDNVGKKQSSSIRAILSGGFSFFKTYILKRGFLDGYAGLVIAFSHMATNFYKYIKLYELNQKKVNILITRHDKIGDFVTSLPLYYVVKKANPNATIYALVSKVNIELAKKIDFIDKVILYDKNHFWHTLKNVRAANIDISISAFIDTKLGWMLFFSNIKTRIAPATKLAQLFFNKTLKQRRSLVEKTEVKYNLDLAKILDEKIDLSYKTPLFELENTQIFRIKNQLQDKKIVLFHPGYGGSSDGNLALEDYLKLAKIVRKLHSVQVVWTFGPDDLNAKESIQMLIPKEDLIYQPPTLMDFCYLIRDSQMLISTSTGPMHLAGILNINTVSFFGNNLFASSKRWATVNDLNKQSNFNIDKDFDFLRIEQSIIRKIC